MNEKHQGAIARWKEIIVACDADTSEEERRYMDWVMKNAVVEWADGEIVEHIVEVAP
ncbi:hypothetical protein J8F10_24205 [Gemmata sp. G18]|uniref:Uncharacterized protein n=1 Tax=Gemmata palustris TaxID=2822762 RepID=A0ABS5BXC9_9BACT|nr:hypothetical protein [Gemmata palustris]MBP3958364.1 hypothetical protein [Gemmata palustris]